uniref:Uncharacterized protein n=1 Tax=Davidia involucrata TaxID=16924 RepID=A0A5B7BVN6_DAVIN
MNALNSPLEALAFNYVTFGFLTVVNNIWTWIAVVTAAVSFWRIRVAGSPKPDPRAARNPDVSPNSKVVSQPPDTVAEPVSSSSTAASLATMTPCVWAVESDGATKGNFTVYYEDDRRGGDGELTLTGKLDADGDFGSGGGEWSYDVCDRSMLRMRMGDDMGWYRFQDMTVFDGNVVRLWDDCRRRVPAISGAGIVIW